MLGGFARGGLLGLAGAAFLLLTEQSFEILLLLAGFGLLGAEGLFELGAMLGKLAGLLFGLLAGGVLGGLAGLAFGNFAGVGVGLLGGAAFGVLGELLGGGLLADELLLELEAGAFGVAYGLFGGLAGDLLRLLAGLPFQLELAAGGGVGVGALLSGQGGGGGLGGQAFELGGEVLTALLGLLDL